jgi:3-oxoacyl-[acyl-carrier-protein] synthase II
MLPAAITRESCGVIPYFDAPRLRSRVGAPVPRSFLIDLALDQSLDPDDDRCLVLGTAAMREALRGLQLSGNVHVSIGLGGAEVIRIRRAYEALRHGGDITPDGLLRTAASIVSAIAARSGIHHGSLSVHQNACAAGLTAIGDAADVLRLGEADMALAGGVEALDLGLHAGFDALRALSSEACRPFDQNRTGTILGEGSAIFVMETVEHAHARGATILAEFAGYGMSNDAYHRTRPDPSGAGQAAAMTAALLDAKADATDVDVVYAHGTGTPANDEVELTAITTVLANRAAEVPIVSIKGATGHTISASGPLNVALALIALNGGTLAGNVGLHEPIQRFQHYRLPQSCTRASVSSVLVNAFAFGGNNSSALIRAWSD